MTGNDVPRFSGPLQKNDALFLYGALQKKPWVSAYVQERIEVVHGPSCRVENEVMTSACAADAVPVYRRRTGGGTVVLSPGVVVTIIVGKRAGTLTAPWYFNRIHDAMIDLFAHQGISGIERDGISDLTLRGRKILGSSLYLGTTPCLYYYQSSLLVASDTSLFERYLCHPPREPAYRSGRTHTSFCTTLEQEGYMLSPSAVADLFTHLLAGKLS